MANFGTCGGSVRRGHHRRRCKEDLNICADTVQDLLRSLASPKTLLVSDYGGLVSDLVAANWSLLPKGVLSIWDPHRTRHDLPSGISVITPTREEAVSVSGIPSNDPESFIAWSDKRKIEAVLVTLGAGGVDALHPSSRTRFTVHGSGITYSDEVGAGDVFCGILAQELARSDLQTATKAAVKAAGKFLKKGGALALSTPFDPPDFLSFGWRVTNRGHP